jgi:hypothetical protein
LPNYNPIGVSTLTVGQDFRKHAAALFTKPSAKKDKDYISNTQSIHGSGLDCIDLGPETLQQDWTVDDLEQDFTTVQDSSNCSNSPDGSKNSSKGIKVCLYSHSG